MRTRLGTRPIPDDVLGGIRALYDDGLFLRAWTLAQEHGPLADWRGVEARILGGRLAARLGGVELSRELHLSAYRLDRTHPEALYYRASALLRHGAIVEGWKFVRDRDLAAGAAPDVRASWYALRAAVLAMFRDFERAAEELARAEEAAPGCPWVGVRRAALLAARDEYEPALAEARKVLLARPRYVPALLECAELLVLTGKADEGVALLAGADPHLESAEIASQLAVLRLDQGDVEGALGSIDRCLALLPLAEEGTGPRAEAVRTEALIRMGRRHDAAQAIRRSPDSWPPGLVQRLEDPAVADRRVRLDVPFVRQHHRTCGPATLTALARFWGLKVDQLEVVEEICYDGTTSHSERRWAEDQGWTVREFSLDWPTSVALLDRGVPFTLATVGPELGHLQAVVGYESLTETLLVRDPTIPTIRRFPFPELLESQRLWGPRAMAMVPPGRAALLDGIEFPDGELLDLNHRLLGALERHDFPASERLAEDLERRAPGHRTTRLARIYLEGYAGRRYRQLGLLDELLREFPKDPRLARNRDAVAEELGRKDLVLARLEARCRAPRPEPHVLAALARALRDDARTGGRIARLVGRAIASRGPTGDDLHVLAGLDWDAGRRARALELYRLASCMDDKREAFAYSHFAAARIERGLEPALAILTARCARLGPLSPAPYLTLHQVLTRSGRAAEASELVERALAVHPDDGDLLRVAAEADAGVGRIDRARSRLAASRSRLPPLEWVRSAARVAAFAGDFEGARDLWTKALEAHPLAAEANRELARLTSILQGAGAATQALRRAVAGYPFSAVLQRCLVDFILAHDPGEVLPELRRLLELDPTDSWTLRELAIQLGASGKVDEALELASRAVCVDPSHSWSHSVLGTCLARAGRIDEARAAFREAIHRCVDNRHAIEQLLDLSNSPEEQRGILATLVREIERQASDGLGVEPWLLAARRVLGPVQAARELEGLAARRRDLPGIQQLRVRVLLEQREVEAAKELASDLVARFPLAPDSWLTRASTLAEGGDVAGELAALERARELDLWSPTAACRLASAHRRLGNPALAREVLTAVARGLPFDARIQADLAVATWELGQADEAREGIRRALRLGSWMEDAWRHLAEWTQGTQGTIGPCELAAELVARRPDDVDAWVALARYGSSPAERLLALDRALAIDPRQSEAIDLMATLLVSEGRFDDALAACGSRAWGPVPPVELRGRAQWVQYQRGRRREALAGMRALVDDAPGFTWGLLQCWSWTRREGDREAAVGFARRLVESRPHEPDFHSYLALSLREGDRPEEALRAARMAIALEPGHTTALDTLLGILVDRADLDGAHRAIEEGRAHGDREVLDAHAVRVELARKRVEPARRAFESLVRARPTREWVLELAVDALAGTSIEDHGLAVLRAALSAGEGTEAIAQVWSKKVLARRDWTGIESGLDSVRGQGFLWEVVIVPYLEALAQHGEADRVRRVLASHGVRLVASDKTWGTAGYALSRLGLDTQAVRWLSDWQGRKGLAPWMLVNLVVSLRCLGRDDEAHDASKRALRLAPDHTTPQHRAWLACDAAHRGDLDLATSHLEELRTETDDAYLKFLGDAAEAMCLAHRAPGGSVAAARDTYEAARRRFPERDRGPELARLDRKVRWLLLRRSRGVLDWLAGAAWMLTS